MKSKLVSIYLLVNIFVLLFSPLVTAHDYITDWGFENECFSITLLYSNLDREEALLRFRLKDGVNQYHFFYKLSEFSRDIPQLLVKEQNSYIPFKELNLNLNTQRKDKVISLRFAEDLQYKTGIYSLTLRPVENTDINPVININLYHPRCAEIVLEKRDVHFKISSGSGRYGIEDSFNLVVKTNYPGWNLKAFSTPLLSGEYMDIGLKNKEVYIPGERIFIACNGSSAVPIEKGGTVIEKDSEIMNKIYLLKLFIDTDSMIKAGKYSGGNIIFRLE